MFKEVSRNSVFKKNLRVDLSDFGVGGPNPKFRGLARKNFGYVVALDEVIKTKYYSTPDVKYSLRYSGSK